MRLLWVDNKCWIKITIKSKFVAVPSEALKCLKPSSRSPYCYDQMVVTFIDFLDGLRILGHMRFSIKNMPLFTIARFHIALCHQLYTLNLRKCSCVCVTASWNPHVSALSNDVSELDLPSVNVCAHYCATGLMPMSISKEACLCATMLECVFPEILSEEAWLAALRVLHVIRNVNFLSLSNSTTGNHSTSWNVKIATCRWNPDCKTAYTPPRFVRTSYITGFSHSKPSFDNFQK